MCGLNLEMGWNELRQAPLDVHERQMECRMGQARLQHTLAHAETKVGGRAEGGFWDYWGSS